MQKIKRKPRKRMFPFFKKSPLSLEKLFSNFINKLLVNKEVYCLTPEGVHNSKTSEILYAVVITTETKKFTIKHISFLFEKVKGTLTVTFYNGPVTRSNENNSVVKKQIIKFSNANVSAIKKSLKKWFGKDPVTRFKVDVSFQTEFPLFSYRNSFYVNSIGTTFASEVMQDIFKREISSKNKKEVRQFYEAYNSARQMTFNTLTTKVISLKTEEEMPMAGQMLNAEIGNQVYESLAPEKNKALSFKLQMSYIKEGLQKTMWWLKSKLFEPSKVVK